MSEPDIVHDMKEELEYHFKISTIVCCGVCAPFEADHQLAVLSQQKQVHDLSVVLLCNKS
jgi:hypothetical protein